MRFCDLLKTAVLSSAMTATVLAVLAVVGVATDGSDWLVFGFMGWWAVAAGVGVVLGRRSDASPPITRLLAAAESKPNLPLPNPARIAINRLWPLGVLTLVAGVMSFWAPQIPAITAGFAIVWALAWRHQATAVLAIELRDGVCFYVKHTSPIHPIELIKVPGKRDELRLLEEPPLDTVEKPLGTGE